MFPAFQPQDSPEEGLNRGSEDKIAPTAVSTGKEADNGLDSMDVVIGADGGVTSNVRVGDINTSVDRINGIWYIVNIANVNINIVDRRDEQ